VTAASPSVPKALLEQLAEGGIMVIPVGGHDTEQLLLRIDKTPDGIRQQHLMPVRFVPLIEEHAKKKQPEKLAP
jgi:protein-L-isoaspartate(D-aspartate) O-methyltransferase